ncbi:MAG: alkylation response protein AidB-like acyl-CoA dehydrogenase [Acidimicrobiales bacterium]|jgi:indole-3-acetate monooxygenase
MRTRYDTNPLVDQARTLEPIVEQTRSEMDEQRRLTAPVVDALRGLGVFRMAVPVDLDGPALDPMTQVAVVEELSRLDGSVGWCTMIAAAGSYVSGFLTPDAATRWFGPADACLGGQLAPTGRAVRVDGGYRVNGRFRFGSGSGHATAMLASCQVIEDGPDGAPIRDDRGRPEIRSALLRPDQVTIIDTWHTTGLWGTGSNDYEVHDVLVADEDSWNPAGAMYRTEPLYRYAPLFLVPHAGVPLGIARAAIDALVDVADGKASAALGGQAKEGRTLADEVQCQEAVAIAEVKLGAARAYTYDTVAELWDVLQAGERVQPKQRAVYRAMMTYGHQVAKEICISLADIGSTSSIFHGEPLQRALRDILTACQHRMVHPKLYVPAGRILLGRDSGDPMV